MHLATQQQANELQQQINYLRREYADFLEALAFNDFYGTRTIAANAYAKLTQAKPTIFTEAS